MLSRVAESIYWMSRYAERAENVARFIEVNLNLMLDAPGVGDHQWAPLVQITGDDAEFARRYGQPTQEAVIHFLAFDAENPNSIRSCIRAARENARTIREVISSEMWLQLNKFHLMVTGAASGPDASAPSHDFFVSVKNANHLFHGIAEATMNRGEAWHFLRMGRMLERADKTSRILDVKYFLLLRSASDVGTPFDDIQWAAVLRSASALETYRQRHGRISPRHVVDFLLMDRTFPRAVQFCLLAARDSLHAITETPPGTFTRSSERLLGQICSDLCYTRVDEIIAAGLHEYLDDLQSRLNRVGNSIHEEFFAIHAPAAMTAPVHLHARASQ